MLIACVNTMSVEPVRQVRIEYCVKAIVERRCQFTMKRTSVHPAPVRISVYAGISLGESSMVITKSKSIVGMDLSTNSIAYAKFVDGKPVTCGEIKIVGANIYEKINDARKKTQALFNIGVLEADFICVEKAVFVNNMSVVIKLANVFGAVMSVLLQNGAQVVEKTPLDWQRSIGNPTLTKFEKAAIMKKTPGKTKSWYSTEARKIRKQRTLDIAQQYFKIGDNSDNVGDAVGISLACMKSLGIKYE